MGGRIVLQAYSMDILSEGEIEMQKCHWRKHKWFITPTMCFNWRVANKDLRCMRRPPND